MFSALVVEMALITMSAFSAGGKVRRQVRKLREAMASDVVLSPSEDGETYDPSTPRPLVP